MVGALLYKVTITGVALIPGDPSLVQRIVEVEEERYKEVVMKLNKELDNLQVCLLFDTKPKNINLIVWYKNMILNISELKKI